MTGPIDELLSWADEQRGDEPRERWLARVIMHLTATLTCVGEGVSPGYMRWPPVHPVAPPRPHHRAVDE